MKKYLFSIFVLMLLMFFVSGCNDANHNSNVDESTITQTDLEPSIPTGTPSIEELHSIVQSSTVDPFWYYASILAFLEGDTEGMAKYGSYSEKLLPLYYDAIATIKIKSYEITKNENGSLDFRFVVSDKGESDFNTGENHYNVWECWTPVTQYSTAEQYNELINLIDWMSGHGCISWENGEATSNFNEYYTFDFGVNRAVRYARTLYAEKGNDLPEFDFDDAVYKMFGVESFKSTSSYLVYDNGEWTETQYVGPINVVNTVVDIRESEESIEVDVQYYADLLRMVPSHKTTIQIKTTDDPIYKYCFEKSVIVEKSDLNPLWWSV